MKLFSQSTNPASLSRTVHPRLEQLEDRSVPSVLAAEFQGAGVWRFESATNMWQRLTPFDADLVAADARGDVVADFKENGLWRFEDATGWQLLTAFNADAVAVGGTGDVVGDFEHSGVWRFENATGWQRLTPFDASLVSINATGDVAASFQNGGVWRFRDATGWVNLTSFAARSLQINDADNVAASFDDGGVWLNIAGLNNGVNGWVNLTSFSARTVAIDANNDVLADFQDAGVWRFTNQAGVGWQRLTTQEARESKAERAEGAEEQGDIALEADGNAFVDIDGRGIISFLAGQLTSTSLTPIDAAFIAAG